VVPGASMEMRHIGPYEVPSAPGKRELRRVFAESVLFGAGATNGPWGLRGENAGDDPLYVRDAELRETTRRLADFYHSWQECLAGSVDAAPVAVLYSFESMGFDDVSSKKAVEAMSQLLLQHQIPFRYVLSDHLEGLDGVKLVILPHVLGVSDEMAAQLRSFVERGGRILATGRSSLYDSSLRMRNDYALADVFGVNFSNQFEAGHQNAILVNDATGCILLPGEWGLTDAEGKPFCAVSEGCIVQSIRHAVGNESLPEVLSPLPHVVFEMRKLSDGSFLLGLLNYSDQPVRSIRITLHGKMAETFRPVAPGDAFGQKVEVSCCRIGEEKLILNIPMLDVELFLMS